MLGVSNLSFIFLNSLIEGKYLNDAFRRYTREPHKVSKEIAQMSPFMADRQVNQMFDVQNLMNELTLNPDK